MTPAQHDKQTIDAEIHIPLATAQLVRFHLSEPSDGLMQPPQEHRLDLCLTPRPKNSRACYRNHWSPHRFERIGDVFLVPAGEALHTRGECGTQASVLCFLRPEPVQNWLDQDIEWTDRRLQASLDIASPHIRSLMLRLGEEMRHPGFASAALVELIVAQMAIELSRYCASVSEAPATGGLAPWRLRLIDERLAELHQAPTLAELAELCNLSVRQLTRGFRASRGSSIGDYMARSRIDVAKRLLASGESVKSIAYSMGFSSPSSFCYAFRKATGEAPRQYRQRMC